MPGWPYPNETTPHELVDHPLRPEPPKEISACPRCGGKNFRPNGSYTSAAGERKQAVECIDCSRGFYLPPGQHLPPKKKPPCPLIDQALRALSDPRPPCPFCGGSDIHRRGILPCGTQRWYCRACEIRFVARGNYRKAGLDRRKMVHFESGNPEEEAKSLFQLAMHYGPLAITRLTMIRGDIMVSRDDRFYLDLLVANGLLDRAEVERAICFRERVLELFDALVTEAMGY